MSLTLSRNSHRVKGRPATIVRPPQAPLLDPQVAREFELQVRKRLAPPVGHAATASSGIAEPPPQAASRSTRHTEKVVRELPGATEQHDADLEVSDCLAVDPSLVQPVIPDPQVVRLMNEGERAQSHLPRRRCASAIRNCQGTCAHERVATVWAATPPHRRADCVRPTPVRDLVVAPIFWSEHWTVTWRIAKIDAH